MKITVPRFCSSVSLILVLWVASLPAQVKPGIEVLLAERMDLIRGKRVGLITNPTGVTSQLVSSIDALYASPEVKLVALFGPGARRARRCVCRPARQ